MGWWEDFVRKNDTWWGRVAHNFDEIFDYRIFQFLTLILISPVLFIVLVLAMIKGLLIWR